MEAIHVKTATKFKILKVSPCALIYDNFYTERVTKSRLLIVIYIQVHWMFGCFRTLSVSVFMQKKTRHHKSEMMNDRYSIPIGEWIIFSVSTFGLALGPTDLIERLAILNRQIVKPNPHNVLHVSTAKFTVFAQVYCFVILTWRNFITDEFGTRKSWPITLGTPAIFDI